VNCDHVINTRLRRARYPGNKLKRGATPLVGSERGAILTARGATARRNPKVANLSSPAGLKQNLMGQADREPTLRRVLGRSGTSTSKARPQFTLRTGAVSLKGRFDPLPMLKQNLVGSVIAKLHQIYALGEMRLHCGLAPPQSQRYLVRHALLARMSTGPSGHVSKTCRGDGQSCRQKAPA
jgi:hypothetical protein